MGGLAMNPGCDCVTMLPCPGGGPSGLKPGCAKAGTAAGCVKGAPGMLKLCIPPGFQCDSQSLHSTISLRILSATWKLSCKEQKSWRCMNLWTWRQILHGKKQANFVVCDPWGEFPSTLCCWPRCPVRSLAIDQVEGPGQKTRNFRDFHKYQRVRVACKNHTWSWNWSLTLTVLKMNSGLNGRINNPCRISSACRLGGLKTAWRGTRETQEPLEVS